MPELLEPVEFTVKTLKGDERRYMLSKFPAVAGREIVAKYPLSSMPKVGDYNLNEETMLKLMCYVGVILPTNTLPLTTKALIDNHVPDWETLAKIEYEMMKYNTSFFGNGEISTFLKDTVQRFLVSVSPTLMTSLQQLLAQTKQASKN